MSKSEHLTPFQKYEKIHRWYKGLIVTEIAIKMGYENGVYFLRKIKANALNDKESELVHRVFDRQLSFQENEEKKHYLNLVN